MKPYILKALLACLPVPLLFTGCVDDNYDLSDIDTESRFKAVDLVLPVNIDPITLGDVVKIDEGSRIQSVNINGKDFYALVEKGDFNSDAIVINGVKAVPTPINPTRDPLSRIINENGAKSKKIPSGEYVYPIENIGNKFSYNAFNIDKSIVSLESVKTSPFTFNLNLEIEDANSTIKSLEFSELEIQMPKGMTAKPSTGSYDSETGIWSIPKVSVQSNHAEVSLTVTAIDTEKAGIKILDDRSLDFQSLFMIEKGYVDITPNSTSFRDQVYLIVNFGLSEFEVNSFSGEIQYALQGMNIPDISLADMPEFLKDAESNIEISNPQIYLQMNNPVADIPLICNTGLILSALRTDLPTLDFVLNNPLVLNKGVGNTSLQNFVLSPSDKNLTVPAQYETGLKWQPFTSLSSLLTTPSDWTQRKLPDMIKVRLVDPSIPIQKVSDFVLPSKLPAVNGNYEIMAPLALNDGSFVYYTDVRDGWNNQDVENITVTSLTVTAHAVNKVPADIQVIIRPIDVNGNIINAEITSNVVPGNSESDVNIVMTGNIQHLDGIRIEAILSSKGNGEPLGKSQTLDLTDIRAKVSGYYDRKL